MPNLPMPTTDFDIAILGAGPGGISAAARATERGLSFVLLEAAAQHANTIQGYQLQKHVMSEPSLLPLRSDLEFTAGTREAILASWQRSLDTSKINIRYRAEAVKITKADGVFTIEFKPGAPVRGGRPLRVKQVILALGIQGNPRRLGVPGDDHACIQTVLACAEDYVRETIMIVGAGDSAIENALALAENNQVIIVNRGSAFPRAKDANALRIRKAIEGKTLRCEYNAAVTRVDNLVAAGGGAACRVFIKTPQGEVSHVCRRVITRLGAVAPRHFIEPIGVHYVAATAEALPVLSARHETSVPGLFIIGALAGYPLIKQAMNQGYEVIEHLSGNSVEPADQALLATKLDAVPFGQGVDGTLELIAKRVRAFKGINSQSLREQVMASKVRAFEPGNEIYVRGDYLDNVFHVLQGMVYLYAPDTERLPIFAGQLIGSNSLLSGGASKATAIAGPDCVLLESPQRMLKKLMRSDPAVRNYVDQVYLVLSLRYLLPKGTPAKTIQTLARSARITRLDTGELLFSEGDRVDRIYLVRSGSVTLSRTADSTETVIAYCAAGSVVDSVGEISGQVSRSVTARATVATEAVSINHDIFVREVNADSALRKQLEGQRAQQIEQYAHMQARPDAGNILSFLMSNGVGEATSVLVIDETLCIGCDQCETACAATHQGVSRLDRRAGPTFLSLHLPTSCRHCEHPHCMSDCPADAIHKLPNGEVSIDDTCIGCGNCEENCPYSVIQMAEVPKPRSLLDRLMGRPAAETPKTAVKCDMCANLKSGPACVNACPTGAAIRIHPKDIVQLAAKRVA
jgi:Fe-S-cluster-containing dehydrogenase component/thioredoxin reductase/CRP-like cAMP-binding protein